MLAAAKLLTLIILPLGDSITEGVPTEDGYRAFLKQDLAAAAVAVEYTGSRRSDAGAHEGWSGFTAEELIPKLKAVLGRVRPDVVLLHIGTNDLGLGVPQERAGKNVTHLLELIDERSRRPDGKGKPPTRVFLAQIIGRNIPGLRRDDEVTTWNHRLATIAAARKKAGQPVEVVDLNAVVDPATDLADALHPSAEGYRKIARGWAAAIKQAYRR